MQIELKLLQSRLGITFIFVTHDQEEAMSMSNRIAIMLDGHIEQLGDPETVYEHPASAFVAGFIGRNNFWQGVATEHGSRADDGTVFVASRPEEDVPNDEPALSAVRPECINLSAERPTNDVNMTKGVVAGVSHFGDVLQYVVTSGARDILVLVPRANVNRFHSGDEVYCTWSADDVYQFSDRQAAIVLHDGTDGSPISDPTSDRKKEKAI
jgi:spermidine/putrescine transport system ATP-binding protein